MTIHTQAFATALANASLMCSVLCKAGSSVRTRPDLGCFRFCVFVSRVSRGIRMCMSGLILCLLLMRFPFMFLFVLNRAVQTARYYFCWMIQLLQIVGWKFGVVSIDANGTRRVLMMFQSCF